MKQYLTNKRESSKFRKIRQAATLFLATSLFCACSIYYMLEFAVETSEPITSQSQLESSIRSMEAELGCQIHIEGYLPGTPGPYVSGISRAGMTSDGKYFIELYPLGQNESTLKHEVFHICDGQLEAIHKIRNPLLKKLIYPYFEAKAIIYEFTGTRP